MGTLDERILEMQPTPKPILHIQLTLWDDGTFTAGSEQLTYQAGWRAGPLTLR
jgi:hypothetical protein